MADRSGDLSAWECALRKLPLPYSLALRLRDAGVAPDLVSEYLGVEEAAVEGVYRMAEAKLSSVMQAAENEARSSARASEAGDAVDGAVRGC